MGQISISWLVGWSTRRKGGNGLSLTMVSLTIASRSGAEYCKTETVLKYALGNGQLVCPVGVGVRRVRRTDRVPAKGFDDGKMLKNLRNEALFTVISMSGIERMSSKMPGGGSGPS